jgi:hypothetical protein
MERDSDKRSSNVSDAPLQRHFTDRSCRVTQDSGMTDQALRKFVTHPPLWPANLLSFSTFRQKYRCRGSYRARHGVGHPRQTAGL